MDNLVKSNLSQIRAIMSAYGVVSAHLFGSAASSTMTNTSDIDFLVRFDPKLSYTEYGKNYFQLIYALENLLNKAVDLVAEETITNPYMLQSINAQKIAVLLPMKRRNF